MATRCIDSEKIIGKNDFPYHFQKIIVRYKKISYRTEQKFYLDINCTVSSLSNTFMNTYIDHTITY